MRELLPMSKAKVSELSKLKQKKYRTESQTVVLEGKRLLQQLADYQVLPLELFYVHPPTELLHPQVPAYLLKAQELTRICESEAPSGMAALYALPSERRADFHSALYLDGVSDPGNLGTIFRLAAAFGIEQILLSPACCEVGNPKLLRASMGAVYQVPFASLDHAQLLATDAHKLYLDMQASLALQDYRPQPEPTVYILGGEAHGVSLDLREQLQHSLRIAMSSGMESLNVAITAGILAHHIFCHQAIRL